MSSSILAVACCCDASPPIPCSDVVAQIVAFFGAFPTSIEVSGAATMSYEKRYVCATSEFGNDYYCTSQIEQVGSYNGRVSGVLHYGFNPFGSSCGYFGLLSLNDEGFVSENLNGRCPWMPPPTEFDCPPSSKSISSRTMATIPASLTFGAFGSTGALLSASGDCQTNIKTVLTGCYCQPDMDCNTNEIIQSTATVFAEFTCNPVALRTPTASPYGMGSGSGFGEFGSRTFSQGVLSCLTVTYNGSISLNPLKTA